MNYSRSNKYDSDKVDISDCIRKGYYLNEKATHISTHPSLQCQ